MNDAVGGNGDGGPAPRVTVDDWIEQRFVLAMAGLAALALALRLWRLGDASLWFDEALEVQRAAAGLRDLIVARGIDQDPPGYSLALHAILALGGTEAWLRLPSALCGAAAAALAAAWGRRAGGPFVGIGTGLLLAVAPVAVHYGQEVNQYAVIIALACALGLGLENVLADRGRRAWTGYTGLAAVSLAVHYGFAFLLAAHLAPLAGRVRRDHWVAGRLVRHLVVLAVVAAVLWFVGLSRSIGVAHLQRRFGGTDLTTELGYIADVGWRDIVVFFAVPFSGGPALLAARWCAVLAIVGAIWLARRGGPGRRVVGVAFLGTLAFVYVASGLGWYPLGHRYALVALPPYLMAVAAGCGAAWARKPIVGAGLLVAAAAGLAAFLPQLDARNPWMTVPREDLRPVLETMASAMTAGDGVYVYYGAAPAFGAYWPRLRPRDALPPIAGRPYVPETAGAEAARIAERTEAQGAVWLVFAHVAPGDHESLLGALVLGNLGPWVIDESVTAENAMAYHLARR